jgi:non-lysosomal glucosylceramidase
MSDCCGSSCSPGGMDRRSFLQGTGAGLAGMAAAGWGGPASAAGDHHVPVDKGLSAADLAALRAPGGGRAWFAGEELDTIGMPVGGVCAGQLYLLGDGRLGCWDLFNEEANSGFGQVNYRAGREGDSVVRGVSRIEPSGGPAQGFRLRWRRSGGGWRERSLDREGIPGVRFCGEYPLGLVDYRAAGLPVSARLTAFSPFVPLAEQDSDLPATVLRWTLRNDGAAPLEVELEGWLDNPVAARSAGPEGGVERVQLPTTFPGGRGLRFAALPATDEPIAPVLFAGFDGEDYGGWEVEGEAFGDGPARGTLPNQQAVSGFDGAGLVNSYLGGDDRLQGRLRSPEFTIGKPWICFLLGGGGHEGRTELRLVVDGEVVRVARGRNSERLEQRNWDVRELAGRRARFEVVDAESGGWGHVNVVRIEFADRPRPRWSGPFEQLPDVGELCLASLDDPTAGPALVDPARGAVARRVRLAPGQQRELVFLLSWYFPNLRNAGRPVGRAYAARFLDAVAVATHLARELPRLEAATRRWHATWYDSSLPRWLLDRIGSTHSILASATCQQWRDGRFWGWEGVGCCHGTCGHVWNYAHAMARLFPALERSVRERQDFSPEGGFVPETGEIRFRGEGWGIWAGDSQAGYVLKALREHQCSADGAFLGRVWPAARRALEFLIGEDGGEAADGLLEGRQHNTYDIDYWGANTMVGSLYLAALRAGEEMARHQGDAAFAARCRALFEAGRAATMERLWNGEWFEQQVDLDQHPDWQYADGCLADQLFGQGWAHQLGLGHLYPPEAVRGALRSIWRYNWAPDVAPQNAAHAPERWFADPGEGGLFTCTWPKGTHLGPRSTRYRNEVWTGIEYQVAGHMAWEGMVDEALALCRAIHDRYHPARRNPWNEVECGDHYARALAAWGVLGGLCGFEADGPRGHLGFAPRLHAEDFRAPFTAAEGWGSYHQRRGAEGQRFELRLDHGRLALRSLAVELQEGVRAAAVELRRDGRPAPSPAFIQDGRRLALSWDRAQQLEAGGRLELLVRG